MKRTRKQIGSLLLAVCMVFTMIPTVAFADSTSQIISFADLADDVDLQEVKSGTTVDGLNLPNTLTATVTTGSAYTATVSDWVSVPTYNGNTAGSYTFTPTLDLAADVTLAPGVTPPTITVKVLEFVSVTGITQVQDTLGMGNSVALSGTVTPANASNQAISWSIKDAGTTVASITEGTLFAPVDGTVTVTATITNGIAIGTDYTQDFTLTVNRLPYTFNWWSVRSPLAEGDALRSTCYGNGTFVAVGDNGTILTSPDGVTRTTRNSGTTNDLWGVTYGNGTFVAVGKSETILTSPDGVTWTTRKSGGAYILEGVSYGNNMFVAVGGIAGGIGKILTSPDGVTWTSRTSDTPNFLIGVSYGNSTFVAVGSSGTIRTSADGVTWTTRTSGTTNNLIGVSYGNSTFVAVGSGGTILTSADGVTWTPRTSGTTNHLRGVSYGNSTFVGVGSGGTILTSPDGVTWTTQTSGTTNELWGASYGNSTFVAVGASGTLVTSSDGVTWTIKTYGTTNDLRGVTYGNGTFVAVGESGTILTSPDGETWILQTSGTTNNLLGVSYGNGTFVAVGRSGTILTSPDGETWTPQISGTTNLLFGVSYGNGIFAVVGDIGIIQTSPDGVTWTRQDYTMRPLRGVSYGNSTFVAVGAFGDIRTSPDGVTWTPQTSGTANYLMGVIYGNSTFMAVGASGTVLTSRDGVTWTSRTSGPTIYGSLSGVSYGNSAFVAVGDNGIIFISQDGVTWTPKIFNFTDDVSYLHAVSYANGTFVTVGSDGYIIQSGTFTTCAVTVNSGTASPSTAGENTTVTITANAAPSGKQFKEWTIVSGGITLANAQASSTTFTMPANAVEVTATYENIPSSTYSITINSGMASTLTAAANEVVTITAITAPSGQRFKEWTIVSGGITLANAKASSTTFIMPAKAVEVTANYEDEDIPSPTYSITINSGTASTLTAAANEVVTITAITAPSGQRFKEWTIVSGGITLANAQASSTTFTMPANAVEVMATYENIPASGTDITAKFADANFLAEVRKALKKGESDEIYDTDVASVKNLSIFNKGIASLAGIEYFTALTALNCDGNQLSTLDVSKNTKLTELSCNSNQLSTLDMSKNTALTYLSCNSNQLSALNVSKNTELTVLDCSGNQLSALDVSNNIKLTALRCQNNQLTALDVSNNSALTTLYCNFNQLTTLDVSNNTALTTLNCSSNYMANESAVNGLDTSRTTIFIFDPQNSSTSAYTVTVNSGTASSSTAVEGATVTITANTPGNGKRFKEWTVVNSGVTLENSQASSTTFIMPANDVEVIATYEDIPGGSSGGGSSSGGSSPANTATIKKNQPNQPITAVSSVTATVGTNGKASASIPDKAVTDAISKAQGEATKQKKTENGISIGLNVTMPKGATTLTATLSQNALNSLVSAGVTNLEINGSPVSISFDKKALKEIQKQTNGNVNITIAPRTNLSETARAIIGTRPVYNITVGHGNNDTVSSFGSGVATIAIPYIPANGEAISGLYAVYVDESGNATRVEGSVYDIDSGSVLFTTPHFSMYGVGYTAPSEKLTDISNHWAKESIDYVVDKGMIDGATETTFAPDTFITRGTLVTALGRLTGENVSSYITSSFTDVDVESTSQPYIEWAYKEGIIHGIGNDEFAPERAITREEIAVIIANFTNATGYTLPVNGESTAYTDASSIGDYYKTAVTAMQQAGIMTGGTDNKFNPKSNATRAEVSSMLHRYIKLIVD